MVTTAQPTARFDVNMPASARALPWRGTRAARTGTCTCGLPVLAGDLVLFKYGRIVLCAWCAGRKVADPVAVAETLAGCTRATSALQVALAAAEPESRRWFRLEAAALTVAHVQQDLGAQPLSHRDLLHLRSRLDAVLHLCGE